MVHKFKYGSHWLPRPKLLLLLQNSESKIWEFVSASCSRGGGTKMRDIEKK